MENKKEILLSYIKANVAPILVDFISGKDLNGAVDGSSRPPRASARGGVFSAVAAS